MPTFNEATQLFAVLSWERYDYFLAESQAAFSPELVGRAGERISLEGRFVQWLPPSTVPSLAGDDVRKIAKAIESVGSLVGDRLQESAYSARLITSNIQTDLRNFRQMFHDEEQVAADEAISAQTKSRVLEFQNEYFQGHRISFDRLGDFVYCFEVGLNPQILLQVPVLADTGTSLSGKQVAEEIGLGVTIFLELLDLLGSLIGVPPTSARVAEKIAKWLEDSRVLKIIRQFIDKLKTVAESGLTDLVRRLTTDLWDLGLKDIFKEAFSITGWGLVWLLVTLLSYLIPGSAAVKVIQFVARVAGLAAKVYKAAH